MATEDHSLTKHQTNNHVKKKRKCITKEKDKLADGTLITSHTQKLDKRSGKQKRQENTAAGRVQVWPWETAPVPLCPKERLVCNKHPLFQCEILEAYCLCY
ncbi:uncharacterized protein LOC135114141 isoform X1 [Scylla paramamosain]|uniref:uncharacterized protein LOC135114141 isoform X1 n=1 Tax=Scylla paramamosain TaxID=85552 RepID=UPI0030831365